MTIFKFTGNGIESLVFEVKVHVDTDSVGRMGLSLIVKAMSYVGARGVALCFFHLRLKNFVLPIVLWVDATFSASALS